MSDTFRDDEDGSMAPDARLRRMLDHAPDADAAPHPATREAILKAARNVAASSSPVAPAAAARTPWWRRLRPSAGGSRMPWNAAFATVLVAMFVTVMWQGEPVPDARLDAPAPAPATPRVEVAPAPAPAMPATPPPAPAAEPVPPPSASPDRVRRERAAESKAAVQERREMQESARRAPSADAGAPAEEEHAAAADASRVQPAAPSAAAPRPAPPAPAAAAGAAAPGLAAAPQMQRRAQETAGVPAGAWRGWTHLRIVAPDGRTRRLTRAEAGELAGLIEAAVPSGLPAAVPEDGSRWQIVLEAGGGALAALEVGGRQVRWREGGAAATAAEPPASVLDALRAELERRFAAGP
ncbi:hypothetical protein [Xenophilus azovorans]|uniref:hypothetical protein n=1 Tax=Xenophilus azovorans TaxID=151755 RepID=UPI00056DCE74|nr:hypothetical protein [Xenophilus azovorans]